MVLRIDFRGATFHSHPGPAQRVVELLKGELRVDSAINRDFGPPHTRTGLAAVVPVQIVALAYGAWLFIFTVVFHLYPENKVILEFVLLLGALPALMHCLLLDLDTRGIASGMWFFWAFMTVFIAGYLAKGCTWEDLVNLFNVVFVFFIGFLVASSVDTSLVQRLSGVYAIMISPYLIYVSLFGVYVWGRLYDGMAPNMWGLIAVSAAVGSFGLRNKLLAAVCWVAVLMTMYNAQTRGSMIALIPVISVFAIHWYVHERKVDVSWKLIITYFVVVGLFVVLAAYPDLLLEKVLRLNDPRRGLASGATGRDEAWLEAARLFFDAPLLGVGFRKHEELMIFTRLSSHNAYLAMLADTGFVGFLVYMAFLISSIVCAYRGIGDSRLRFFLLGVILAYSLVGLFERRAINVGNPMSIIFIFACLQALRMAHFRFRFGALEPPVPAARL